MIQNDTLVLSIHGRHKYLAKPRVRFSPENIIGECYLGAVNEGLQWEKTGGRKSSEKPMFSWSLLRESTLTDQQTPKRRRWPSVRRGRRGLRSNTRASIQRMDELGFIVILSFRKEQIRIRLLTDSKNNTFAIP